MIALQAAIADPKELSKLQSLLAPSALAAAVFDRQMQYRVINDAWAKTFGVAPEAVIGRSIYDLDPDTIRNQPKFERVLAGEADDTPRYPQSTRQGMRWMRSSLRPWQGARGRIDGLVCLLEDLGGMERPVSRRAGAGRAAGKLAELGFDQAPQAMLMADRKLVIRQVNARWRDLYGYGDEVVGERLSTILPHLVGLHGPEIEALLAGSPTPVVMVVPYGRKEQRGAWRRIILANWRTPDGEVGGLLCGAEDVSEEVEAKREIERSERRLSLAAQIAKLHVYDLDHKARTLTWRTGPPPPAFEAKYDEVAVDPLALAHADDRASIAETWREQDLAGEPFRAEFRLARAVEPVWVFAGAEEIFDAAGQVSGRVGVLKDITARKLSEEAAYRARGVAEAASRAKSEFLANMSHELRTPLNGVIGITSVLATEGLSPRQAELVRLIAESGSALERLLGDLLDFASLETGALELRVQRFDVVEAVQRVARLFEPQARAKGLGFRLEVNGPPSAWALGDAARLRQVFANLLSNAVKFTEAGGVQMHADVHPEGSGPVAIRISVADTGVGFDAAFAERLFQEFQQADGSNSRRFGGSGLGLALARTLVERMGGTIAAVSTPGAGSVFTVALDLPSASAGAEEPQAPAPETPSTLRVLLAEDHPVNRRVVALILEPFGAQITEAENGRDAVDAAAAQGFDLVLMDMQMPVMDGLTAIRLIREREDREKLPRTPILMLTANALAEHVEQALAAGADAHVAKPVTAESLVQAIEAVLMGR